MSLPLSEIAFHDAVDAELRGQRVAMPLAPDDPAWLRIRAEALRILEGRGSILHVALEVSRLLATAGFSTPIIGGVAVVLHGYLRTTRGVDVLVDDDLDYVGVELNEAGYSYGSDGFGRDGVPIRLVPIAETGLMAFLPTEIDGITTVGLADLIAMKLRSGWKNLIRSLDLADAIGLIRRHELGAEFAAQLPKDVRRAYHKIVKAILAERQRIGCSQPDDGSHPHAT